MSFNLLAQYKGGEKDGSTQKVSVFIKLDGMVVGADTLDIYVFDSVYMGGGGDGHSLGRTEAIHLDGSPAPMHGTYYVTALTSSDRIYSSITNALADLTRRGVDSAVTILLSDSFYLSEAYPLSLGRIRGASQLKPVQLKADSGASVLLTNSSATSIFHLLNTSYFTLGGGDTSSSFTLLNTNSSSTAALLHLEQIADSLPSEKLSLRGLKLQGSGASSLIQVSGAQTDTLQDLEVINNHLKGAKYGVLIQSAGLRSRIDSNSFGDSLLPITRCAVYVNGQDSIELSNNLVKYIKGQEDSVAAFELHTTRGATISGNTIYTIHNRRTGIGSAIGIYLSNAYPSDSSNPTVNLIVNNMISDVASSNGPSIAIALEKGYADRAWHNSIWLSGGDTASSLTGVFLSGAASDVRNNAVLVEGGDTARALQIAAEDLLLAPAIFSYNLLYARALSKAALVQLADSSYSTISRWQIKYPSDSTSISALPYFISLHNLHGSDNSCILRRRGAELAVASDVDGEQRLPVPALGADEFFGSSGRWIGTTDSSWHNGLNWCNDSIPTCSSIVYIPAAALQMPSISQANGAAGGLELEKGTAIYILGKQLRICNRGRITNYGLLHIKQGGTLVQEEL